MQQHESVAPIEDRSLSPNVPQSNALHLMLRLTEAVEHCSDQLHRLADHFCPPPDAVVDTQFVATKLNLSIERISQMVRGGEIPKICIVDGTGNGKPWKFHRRHVEEWLRSR